MVFFYRLIHQEVPKLFQEHLTIKFLEDLESNDQFLKFRNLIKSF